MSLLLISLGLRVYHLTSGHFHDFSHDIDSHLHFVQYVRSNWELPPVNLELEDAQQPLYYIIAALFYQPQLTTDVNIDVLGPLGLCISTAGLCLVCRALFFISSWIVRYGVFIYFAFTPAFIITSCVVGNDVLFSFFGAYFFLCVLRFNRTPSSRNLALLMLALTGALFSKLGGIVLLAAIPWVLWRSSRQDRTWHPTALRCALFALLVSI